MHLRESPVPVTHEPDAEISAFCPRFQYTIELLGRRWVGAIVRALVAEPRRFNEILAAVPGLSDRLLTERLRELEREGLVERTVHDSRPVRVTYALTESGDSLIPVLREISDWAERWVDIPPDWSPTGS
jgi:DNA-binding HxlR family transcriptional regulator